MKTYKIKYFFHQLTGIIPSSILCLRFPFLYPRNRFTDKHYNNWTIIDKRQDLWKEYHIVRYEDMSAEGGSTFEKVEDRWSSKAKCIQWYLLGWVHKLLEIIHAIPYYTELDNMPTGWRKAFGIQMCKEIRHELYKVGGIKRLFIYRIDDIKEKWGALQWYDHGGTYGTQKVIAKYSFISERTCICCGELATCITPIECWRSPYCDQHVPKHYHYLLDYGLNGNEWYGWSGNINGRSQEEYESRKEMYEEYLKSRE